MSAGAQPWERRKRYASVSDFAKARLRKSEHDSTNTTLSCLYAHYRRWAFLSDLLSLSVERFEADLKKLCKNEAEEFRGHRVYPVEVVLPWESDAPVEASKKATKPKSRVLGQVEFTRQVSFGSDAIQIGEALDWMEPNESEKETIESKATVKFSRATQHIVVMFRGTRRIVSTDGLRRKL